jgi:hypothetical protein
MTIFFLRQLVEYIKSSHGRTKINRCRRRKKVETLHGQAHIPRGRCQLFGQRMEGKWNTQFLTCKNF